MWLTDFTIYLAKFEDLGVNKNCVSLEWSLRFTRLIVHNDELVVPSDNLLLLLSSSYAVSLGRRLLSWNCIRPCFNNLASIVKYWHHSGPNEKIYFNLTTCFFFIPVTSSLTNGDKCLNAHMESLLEWKPVSSRSYVLESKLLLFYILSTCFIAICCRSKFHLLVTKD